VRQVHAELIQDLKPDMSASLQIRSLGPPDITAWNDFVSRTAGGTFFHCAEWKEVFEKSLHHTAYYFLAEAGGEICGILPLVHIRSRLFGNLLASLPFLAYGGSVTTDDEIAVALEAEARALAQRLDVNYIEYRNRATKRPGLETKSAYVTFRKKLPDTTDECMQMIPRKQRAMVRKGIKHGLEARVENHLDNFYPIFSESYRNLGTPVLAKKYFEAIRQAFGKNCEVLTIFKDDRAIASVMSYYFRDEVIPYYGGSRSAARGLMANDFMYWELMRRSCEAGIRVFDYGRSREGTGSYRFKKHWGFVPEPLHYQYDLVGQGGMPDLSPGNPKYRLAISIWKRLPTGLTRWLGPMVAKNLPG